MNSSLLQNFPGTIHLVFSSHWDREWYLPFQKFRGKLVDVLDQVLDELESGRLPFYQMDGQFVPIDDYLQIRPDREKRIRHFAAEGRLLLGPWFNLPDEFLVSGESLVRNLQMGMRRSAEFGGTSKTGWLCDIFGHNSQMPQLLTQMGIDNAILWRGVDWDSAPNPFWWRGADGARVLVHRFDQNGYVDFGSDVRKAQEPGQRPSVEEMLQTATTHFEKTRAGSGATDLLWFDGGDHLEYDPQILEMAARFNATAGREVIKVSTLDRFIESLRKDGASGAGIQGELRQPARMETYGFLIPGVGSSRVPLKQANHAGETLLTLWAEPWCAIANFWAGRSFPSAALDLAWRYLLLNHPHDSICGCSTDETHAAMPYRSDQSRHIAEYYLERAFKLISRLAWRGKLNEKEIGLSVFTAAGGMAQQAPEIELQLPRDWPQFGEFFGFEMKPSLKIYDLAGNEVSYQLLKVASASAYVRALPNHLPALEERQKICIALDTVIEPATVRHFLVRRAAGPTRIPVHSQIGVARNVLRNEHLQVTATSEGTIEIFDITTGRIFSGLLAMEDTADIGDGWFHGIALADRGYLSTGGSITFGLAENGPLLARLMIRVEWLVPEDFDFKLNERSSRLRPLVVEHSITLRRGDAHVEVDTTVHNNVRDHRLRLFCPTSLSDFPSYLSDTPFDAVERSVETGKDNHLRREIQVEMTPQQNWVAASDGARGLALIAPGQYESAMLKQPDCPLCVTLLRAFRKAVFTDGNDGGQIQGSHRFRLALFPISGEINSAALFRIAQKLATPARSVTSEALDDPHYTGEPPLRIIDPPRIEGDVVFSACLWNDRRSWTYRIFNPSGKPVAITLIGGNSWEMSDLRAMQFTPLAERNRTVAPKQILTLRVHLPV